MNVEGAGALVAGGASGLGAATSRALAGAGAQVVIADLNAEPIVFPLGPNLILSWATCTVEVAPGRNKIYRCELKPGYQFQ